MQETKKSLLRGLWDNPNLTPAIKVGIQILCLVLALAAGTGTVTLCCMQEQDFLSTVHQASTSVSTVVDGALMENSTLRERIKERILIRPSKDGIAEVLFDGQLISLAISLVWLIKIACYTMMAVAVALVALCFIGCAWVVTKAGASVLGLFKSS